jgi:hypothetical protein
VQQVVQFLELGMFAALGLLYLIIFIFILFLLFLFFLRRRPTDDMFSGGLNITNFVEMNFPT